MKDSKTADVPLREGWVECELVDACQILDNLRKPINASERARRIIGKLSEELFPYYGATGQVDYIDAFLTDGEFVLIGEDGAPFLNFKKDVAYLITGKTWVNNHAHILKSYLNNKFLLYFLNQFNYNGYVSGTTRLKLTQTKLKKIPLIIAPLPEQRAIVSKIEQLFSELDNGISNLKAACDKLEIYRQAVLKKAFEGDLTREWRNKQINLPMADVLLDRIKKEHEKYYNIQLAEWENAIKTWEENGLEGKKPRKPKSISFVGVKEIKIKNSNIGWLNVVCGDVGEVKLGRQRSPKHHSGKHMRQYLRVANVHENRIDLSDVLEMNFTPSEFEIYRLEYGDILLNEGQSLELVGRPAMFRNEILDVCFQNTLVRFRSNKFIDSKYALYLFLLYYHSGKFQKIAKWTTTMAHLGANRFSKLVIPICSLEEQKQIVTEIESRLSVCDNIKVTIDESLERAEALRQSILKKAFEGRLLSAEELRACRNAPDWEPAEKLLERIKSENKAGSRK